MPETKAPENRFLSVSDWRKAIGKATKTEEKYFVIVEAPTEEGKSLSMLQAKIFNPLTGEKLIYDYKNKFTAFYDAHGTNTDNWVGAKLLPILPEGESIFFNRFEVAPVVEEHIA